LLPAPPANPWPLEASHPNGLPAGQAANKIFMSLCEIRLVSVSLMITIKFFAMLKNKVGRDEAAISIPGQITLMELKVLLKKEFPSIREFIDKSIMISVNQEFAASGTVIKDGDEVALLPPFSGG